MCGTKQLFLIKNTFFLEDLLIVNPHTPTPEPVKYDKKDGQWYGHDGVDVHDMLQRKGTRRTFKFCWVSASVLGNYFALLQFTLNTFKIINT